MNQRRVGRRGERRGVGSWLEEAEQLEVEVEVEVELEAKLELEVALPAVALVDMGDTVHKSFLKPVHNSSVHTSVHNLFMTTISVL